VVADHQGPGIKAEWIRPLPEEAIKYFVRVSIAEKHVDVRSLQDTLVLALAVSLGFAALENCFYVISGDDWRTTASLRAITSVPGHGLNGLAMGALLISARSSGDKKPSRIFCALIVPIALHAAYDFPLFAIEKNVEGVWFAARWLLIIALSSLFVIAMCNRVLPKAAAADRALGHDDGSVEATDRLIVGGFIALLAGPVLAS
jgi:RsiW-degrading membrane proteinase PrsW (M82 family)